MIANRLLLFLIPAAFALPAKAAENVDAQIYEGWKTVRAMDCARCHGAKFEGQVGPSLVASVKNRDKEAFERLILEGNAKLGMPAYKTIESVVKNIDAIHAYFKALADGKIKPGKLEKP